MFWQGQNQMEHSGRKHTQSCSLCENSGWVASSLVHVFVLTNHESLQHWETEVLNKAMSPPGRRCRSQEFLNQLKNLVGKVIGIPVQPWGGGAADLDAASSSAFGSNVQDQTQFAVKSFQKMPQGVMRLLHYAGSKLPYSIQNLVTAIHFRLIFTSKHHHGFAIIS